MKFLIVSDLHAMSQDILDVCESSQARPGGVVRGGYNGSTRGLFFVEDRSPSRNRVLAIRNAIKETEHLGSIDAIICLGDISHQCKRSVALAVWRDLSDLAHDLDIQDLFAVPGNHDVAAKEVDFAKGAPDAFLKEIRPRFPYRDGTVYDHFHQHQFALVERGSVLLILLNTCSLIGYGGSNREELFRKGFISDKVILSIEQAVSKNNFSNIILAMHHHPMPVHPLHDPEGDFIEAGAQLIKALQGSGKPSIILHGHKHFVNFKAANTNGNAPWILSSSSLGSKPYDGFEENYSCQFHVLDLPDNSHDPKDLRGKIWSWDWVVSKWEPAKTNGLPAQFGFSSMVDLSAIAARIYSLVQTGGAVSGSDAKAKVPDLDFITAEQLQELATILKSTYSVEMVSSGGSSKLSFWLEN